MKPAWTWQFEHGWLREHEVDIPTAITPEWAWGDATGAGVRVAIVDSGVDANHPAVGGVDGGAAIVFDPERPNGVRIDEGPHEDLFGHGTACAAIVRAIAPEVELYSVRVLGKRLTGKGFVFAAGLRWCIDNGMHVVNLSLSTRNQRHFASLHRLVDEAVFRRMMLVASIANEPGPSYPAEFSGVFSVASHVGDDAFAFDYNPTPPAEWGAPGIDLNVAWLDGATIEATGNSFASPHIAGIVARVLSKHPSLTPFQMKTVLSTLSSNATPHHAPDRANETANDRVEGEATSLTRPRDVCA